MQTSSQKKIKRQSPWKLLSIFCAKKEAYRFQPANQPLLYILILTKVLTQKYKHINVARYGTFMKIPSSIKNFCKSLDSHSQEMSPCTCRI